MATKKAFLAEKYKLSTDMLPIAELISFKLFGRYKEAKCPSPLRQFHPLDILSSRIDILPTIWVFSKFNLPPERALSRIKELKT